MTRSLSFVPQQRLASLLRRGGGVSVDVAVQEAEQRVQALKDSCVGVLDSKIDQLGGMVAECAPPTRLYAASSEIYSLAATFEVTELSQAASSLCDLLTGTQTHSEAELKRAVEVHLDALRTLRRPELSGDTAARIAVVEGLRQIALKYKTE
jgi:hypothetical protein